MSSQEPVKLPAEFDTLRVGVVLYNPETGDVLDGNERIETMLGYPIEALRDLSIEQYTANTYSHSEAEFKRRLRESATGGPQRFTWRVKRADGELIWTQIHLTPRPSATPGRVRAEFREITEFYESYHRAELFWRILRHNLRNEATVILGNADRIATHSKSSRAQEAAATIRQSAEGLGHIVDSVKEIEQAVTRPDTAAVQRDAATAINEIVAVLATEYPAADISVTEREKMGIEVTDAFSTALRHAIENAIVHNPDTKPAVGVCVGSSPNTGRVEIRVSDTNPPIPESEFRELFQPTETTGISHGSGVGLFVMKWCIESLGGELKFERNAQGGNTVYFYLPPKPIPDA